MFTKTLHIRKYDWTVHCYFAVTTYYADEILRDLCRLHISPKALRLAKHNLYASKLDTGITFSNGAMHESVMVTSLTSSPAEFLDSFTHELRHLADDIGREYGIKHDGEEIAYLIGDTARALYKTIKPLLCKHCRKSLRK